ncbi:MAG: TIGR00730 family Rossman fold protein [Chloroflexota bacterium]
MTYEINDLAKEESWRILRIMGELIEGFDNLSDVEPAVSIYGSARIKPSDELYVHTQEIGRRLGAMGYSIITGGGPGVMEAANRGAREAGAKSIGLNIVLPREQVNNPYANRSISFNHFFVRKVMLVKYATAFIIMPGGLGTLDELTEILTLMQTEKIKPFPVILFDGEFWNEFLDWLRCSALTRGYISEEDFNLLRICDDPDCVIDVVRKWHDSRELVGKKALV